ncbi:hypothetical protein E9993_19490 [Labilibacter sediminis]|nr:hypothetical protein E9993_19490 [Labilibacter sediminis]
MENEFREEISEVRALTISENTSVFLLSAAKWAKFIAIMGFIAVGFMVLGGLFSGIVMSFMENEFAMMPFPPFIFSFLYLAMGALYFFPVYYLFKFSTQAQYAIQTLNTTQLEIAFRNIKSYFKFIGVLIIVMLSLYALAIIGAITFALFFKAML